MNSFVCCLFENDQQSLPAALNDVLEHESFSSPVNPGDEIGFLDNHIFFCYRPLGNILPNNGCKPLSFADERYWILFNGEIYNTDELIKILEAEGTFMQTNSSAEVVVALYSRFQEKTVEKLRGMFAFVIWDQQERTLFAARDPFGIKPLYFFMDKEKILFSSEKKSLLEILNHTDLDFDALQHYLTYQYVPEPSTMSSGIKRLEPGHCLIKKTGAPAKITKYWQVAFQPVIKSKDDFVNEIRNVLTESVLAHLKKDAPAGAFLSGGIDSTFIAALAKDFYPGLRTFSVGFDINGYSEIDIAKETAGKIGVENISCIITPEEFMNEIPKIMWIMDDPLADPACVPLYFAAREASKYVNVVLSGEGADELFGGYNIYHEPDSLRIFDKMPGMMKKILKFFARLMPDGMKGKSFIERGTTPLEERYIGNAKMYVEEKNGSCCAL